MAALDPGRFLALRAPIDVRAARPFDTSGVRPRMYTDSVWCFQLKELRGERTRLLVSGCGAKRPRALLAVIDCLFWEPAHRVMQKRQFKNLARRSEATAARTVEHHDQPAAALA